MDPDPTTTLSKETFHTDVDPPLQDSSPLEGVIRTRNGHHWGKLIFPPKSPSVRARSLTEVSSSGDKYELDTNMTMTTNNIQKGRSSSITHSQDTSASARNRQQQGPIHHIRKGLHARKERREQRILLRQLSDGGGGGEIFQDPLVSSFHPAVDASSTSEQQQQHVAGQQMQQQYPKLSHGKVNISFVLEETARMNRNIKQISKKMKRLSQVIIKLESQLHVASKALDHQRTLLHNNITTWKEVNVLRKTLEQQVGEIQEDMYFIAASSTSTSTRNNNTIIHKPTRPTSAYDDSLSLDSSEEDEEESFATALEVLNDINFNFDDYDDDDDVEKDEIETTSVLVLQPMDASLQIKEDQDSPGTEVSSLLNEEENSSTSHSKDADLLSTSFPYLRVDDLDMLFHEPSSTRPNKVLRLPLEAASDCQKVVDALTQRALQCIVDDNTMWIPERATERILSKYAQTVSSISPQWYPIMEKEHILLWSGKLDSSTYGNDLPVIKARGLISCSPRELMEMLVDSSQVKEYNKMSLGRMDEWVIHQGVDIPTAGGTIGETKISRSSSKIPLIRKPIEFWTLMHARSLSPSTCTTTSYPIKGYIVVTRSLWEDEDKVPTMESRGYGMVDGNATTIRSEVLLSVNLIRAVNDGTSSEDGDDESCCNQCELTTMNHMYSPCAPSIGAKTLGLKAAYNFIRDLQSYFD